MAVSLQSHHDPDRTLRQHVCEVRKAGEAILARHSRRIRDLVAEWLHWAILFHDVGKAVPEFQRYIRDPRWYRAHGNASKAHAPASVFWWVAYSAKHDLPSNLVTAVAAVVWRHHGTFPEFDAATGLLYCLSGHADMLSAQLDNFPMAEIARDLDVDLPAHAKLDTTFEDEIIGRYRPDDLGLDEAALFRLRTQILFSLLVESDRAYLALDADALAGYLAPAADKLPGASVVDEFVRGKPRTPVSDLQTELRRQVVGRASPPVATVTLPTGMGKTLIAAQWALQERMDRDNATVRKIVIVLPFLSVVDQTVREYRDLLGLGRENDILLEAHSLAPRYYACAEDADADALRTENNARDFIADTWQAPIVITTFDQFLYTLFSSEGRHLLRFHNLADAAVVMDEIQAIPPRLWQPLSLAVEHLAREMNTRFLVMSATQPGFLSSAAELVPNPSAVFAQQRRYQIELCCSESQTVDQFVAYCHEQLDGEWEGKRILLVLNTRRSARQLRDALEEHLDDKLPLFFLSADVIPRERLRAIDRIKEDTPCVVVSTQCIEAGVDIDMDLIVRDFAPLDSIIQVAGRCNRRGHRARGTVRVVRLKDTNGKSLCQYVYDSILLDATATVLGNGHSLNEEGVLPVLTTYYAELAKRKDCGRTVAEDWAYWRAEMDVRAILRGDASKHEFLVESQDEPDPGELPLREAISQALEIEDRWERRRAVRALGARIASLTVSVWARPGLEPAELAEPMGPWWLLRPDFYEPNRGFTTEPLPLGRACLLL